MQKDTIKTQPPYPNEVPQPNTFGQLMKSYRIDKGYFHVSELHRALVAAGYAVVQSTITKYENGTRTPTASFICEFVKLLGLGTEEEDKLITAVMSDKAYTFVQEYIAAKGQRN